MKVIVNMNYTLINEFYGNLAFPEILTLKKAESLNRSAQLSFTEILKTVAFGIAVES